MMSASSQLITQRTKQQQRYLVNTLPRPEGTTSSLPPKMRISTSGSKSSSSGNQSSSGDGGISNSKSPPQQVLKQITGGIPYHEDSLKMSDKYSESKTNEGIKTDGLISAKKGSTVSLFPKSGDSSKRDVSSKQCNSTKRVKSPNQDTIIKQEETLSESTTSSNNQMQESGTTNHKEVAKQLNQYLENPAGNGLNAANKLIDYVRNKALFSNSQSNNPSLSQRSAAQSSIINQDSNQQSSQSVPFTHQSKFFELDFKPLQMPVSMVLTNSRSGLTAAQKKRKAAAAANSMTSASTLPNGTRIPDMQEWFNSLSVEDRVLTMTIVDEFFAKSVSKMQSQINKKGQGMFKFQARVIKGVASVKGTNISQMNSSDESYVTQDFQFQSLKAIMESHKDQLLLQSKQIHEKEFLDYVKLTNTEISPLNNDTNARAKSLNTITVSPSLVQQPSKMFELINSIAGQNFLKVPLEISMDEFQLLFTTRTPIWFNASEANSLAYWILFYLEISMWVHYLSYVRGQFRTFDQEDSINKKIFFSKEEQQINIKNELGPFWLQITSSDSSHKVVKEIGAELYAKSQKINLRSESCPSLISQLNGGLSDIAINGKHSESSTRIMEVLINYQEPQKFMTDLCMVSLTRVDDLTIYQLNQIFVDILREKMIALKSQPPSTNPKNKKKKDKKKQKLQLKRQKTTLNQDDQESQSEDESQVVNQGSPPKIVSKFEEEEEKKEPVRTQVLSYNSSSSEEEDTFKYQADNTKNRFDDEICSNQQLIQIQQIQSPKNQRDRGAIDEILSELIFDDRPSNRKENDNFIDLQDQQNNQIESIAKDSSEKLENQEKIASDSNNDISQKKKAPPKKPRGNNWRRAVADSDNQREVSPVINAIQIIRSQKPLSNNEDTQALKKTKKKKRSKAVGPNVSTTTPKEAPSSVLNNFIRTIIQSDAEAEEIKEVQEVQTKNKKRNQQETDIQSGNKFQRVIQTANNSQKQRSFIQHNINDDNNQSSSEKQIGQNSNIRPVYVKKGTFVNSSNSKEETKETIRSYSISHDKLDYKDKGQSKPCGVPSFDKTLSASNVPMRLNSLDMHNKYETSLDIDNTSQDTHKSNTHKKKNNNKRKNQVLPSNKYKKSNNQDNHIQLDQYYQQSNQGIIDPNLFVGVPGRTMSPGQMGLDQNFGFSHQMFDQSQLFVQTIIDQIRSQLPHIATMQQQESFNTPNGGLQQQINQFITAANFNGQQANDVQEEADEDNNLSEEYYQSLDSQIINMVKETERMLDSVRKEREDVIKNIHTYVKETFKNTFNNGCLGNSSVVGIKLYGSMASGLAIEQSDVDLAVVGLDLNGSKDLQLQLMKKLCDNLEFFMKTYSTIKFIDTATVPVIKLQVDLQKISKNINKYQMSLSSSSDVQVSDIKESMRYLGIDITFEDSSSRVNQGIQCISFIKELCFKQPQLKPIVLVLKKILQKYNLNQPYSGGLNSYSLVLMTSAFLKRFGGEVESISKNLQEILNYYGVYFNPQETMINANLDLISGQLLVSDPMTVIDPHNMTNNVTRSSFRIQDIKEIFIRSFEFLIAQHNQFKKNSQLQFEIGTQRYDVIQRLTSESS